MTDDQGSVTGGGNRAMQERYALAFARIKAAMDAGFPIEAAMITESIIVDRLVSHFRRRHELGYPIKEAAIRRSFLVPSPDEVPTHIGIGMAIKELRLHFDDLGVEAYVGLPQQIQDWTKVRNVAAHQFVKAHPIERTYDVSHDVFLDRLTKCARDGVELARAVGNWTRRRGALHVPPRA